MDEADKDFRDDGRADRTEAQAVVPDLGFLKDVVPKRRRGMEALLLGDGAVGRAVAVGCDLVRRQRVLDLHVLGHILSRWQAEVDAALEVAEREIAAAARQVVQRRDKIGVELARWRHGDGRAAAGAEFVEPSPVDDPVRRQRWKADTAGREVAYDVARKTRESEEQTEVLRRVEHLVMRIALAHHRVAEAIGGR